MIFRSLFRDQLTGYIELRRGLGYRFETEAYVLRAFDRYVVGKDHRELTQEVAVNFATANPDVCTNYRAQRYRVVRHFSLYLAILDSRTPLLDPKAMQPSGERTPPHAYTDEELARILDVALSISPDNPIRGLALHTMVGLGASTGLRIGEVVGLDRTDVDLVTGALLVRQAKFGKDRCVPVHTTTLAVLRDYAIARDIAFTKCDHPAFFLNMRQRRFCRNTLQQAFCTLARRAGLRGPKGRGPSFHNLRHRFATARLVAWYKAGLDVQAMLPALATYMGHVHYSDTAYYLTASAELLGLAAERRKSLLRRGGA